MPVLTRLDGVRIVIRSNEVDYHAPHFHALVGHDERGASIRIGTDKADELVYACDLTKAELARAMTWAATRRRALMENWDLIQAGQPHYMIDP